MMEEAPACWPKTHGFPNQNPLSTKETDSPDPVDMAQRCVLLHTRAMMHKGERYSGLTRKLIPTGLKN